MQSPKTISDTIDAIESWDREELTKNLHNVLPILRTSLSKIEQKSILLRCVHILLDQCLECVPITQLDSDILKHALPSAKNIFNEALEGITVVLQDANNFSDEELEITLASLHHICGGLLEQLKKVVLHISKYCPLPAEEVASVPCSILQILVKAFDYCRESEEIYTNSRSLLEEFFQNCSSLLVCLETLLTSGLQFHLTVENNEALLVNVLESLSCVAKATTTLGIHVQTTAWKTYIVLVERHKTLTYLWTTCDVCTPIEVLASSTSDILLTLLEHPFSDHALGIKTLIVLSFLVRVLTRLCNVFTGYLTDKCMPSIFKLLTVLHRCSIDGCEEEKINPLFLKEARNRVGVATTSLISSLVNDRAFQQVLQFHVFHSKSERLLLTEDGNNSSQKFSCNLQFFSKVYFSTMEKGITAENSLGWLLTGASLCRILISTDIDTRKLWIHGPNDSIFKHIFHLLECCHAELCGDMKCTAINAPGKPTRFGDLYEHILTSVGALMLLIPADMYPHIETLLYKNVCQIEPWRALFAIDLWCIIERQSPTSVRMSHSTFLIEQLNAQEYKQCCPIQVHLRILFARLWPLLPPQNQQFFLTKYSPAIMPDVWYGVSLKMFPENIIVADELNQASSLIESFVNTPTIESFRAMMKKMKLTVILLSVQKNTIPNEGFLYSMSKSVLMLWQLMGTQLLKFADECWISNFFCTLCDLTSVSFPILQNSCILEVLQKIFIILHSSLSHIKLKVLNVLRDIAEVRIENSSEQHHIFQLIADIFIAGMENSNLVIQQKTFEVFEYFAHVTTHEEIVKLCLKRNKSVQERIAQYLKKTPVHPVPNTKGFLSKDYLKYQCLNKFTHQCKEKSERICPKSERVENNISDLLDFDDDLELCDMPDPEVIRTINRLQQDSEFVLQYCKKKCSVKSICNKIIMDISKVKQTINESYELLES